MNCLVLDQNSPMCAFGATSEPFCAEPASQAKRVDTNPFCLGSLGALGGAQCGRQVVFNPVATIPAPRTRTITVPGSTIAEPCGESASGFTRKAHSVGPELARVALHAAG
jgi:hypothetical protein